MMANTKKAGLRVQILRSRRVRLAVSAAAKRTRRPSGTAGTSIATSIPDASAVVTASSLMPAHPPAGPSPARRTFAGGHLLCGDVARPTPLLPHRAR
jgi:hypothetical protein